MTTPPDTDQYVWRWVTKLKNDGTIMSELTQIRISQP